MKNVFKLCVIAACICAGCYANRSTSSQEEGLENLYMRNVEALASGEGGGTRYYCFGTGEIDCNGQKVAQVIYNLR